jgi:hypothetical protein
MDMDRNFLRVAGVASILTAVFMICNAVTLLAAVGNNSNALLDPALMLPLGAGAARMFHASMVFDLLAYLSLAPVTVFWWSQLKEGREGLVSLYAFCGLAYSLLGSIGAVLADAVLPAMMTGYSTAPASQQEMLQIFARYFYRGIEHGIWNPLEVLMVSVWFLGLGLLLRRMKPGLGILALVAGTVGLLDPIGWMLGSDTVLSIGAIGNVLIPVWTAWFGIAILRNPLFLATEEGAAHAGQSQGIA